MLALTTNTGLFHFLLIIQIVLLSRATKACCVILFYFASHTLQSRSRFRLQELRNALISLLNYVR